MLQNVYSSSKFYRRMGYPFKVQTSSLPHPGIPTDISFAVERKLNNDVNDTKFNFTQHKPRDWYWPAYIFSPYFSWSGKYVFAFSRCATLGWSHQWTENSTEDLIYGNNCSCYVWQNEIKCHLYFIRTAKGPHVEPVLTWLVMLKENCLNLPFFYLPFLK